MLACPMIHGFVYNIENVGQTISDPGQKLIVDTLPSIWQYPFFQNDIQIQVFCQNRQIQKIVSFLYCIAYCIAYSSRLESLGPIHSAWIARSPIVFSGLVLPTKSRESPPAEALASAGGDSRDFVGSTSLRNTIGERAIQ